MKLLNVSVEGVGRFGTAARLEGLGAGVNILSAHNEAGKSTMFRAIRTCLFERHNTTRDEVKRLATEGLSLPVKMTIGFEHDGQNFELTKSFLRSPAAKLTCNGIEIARNRDADEKLWEILGITPDNKIDQGAYGVLWVEQGQSFYVPEPSEAAASVLNNVIQQEVGTLVGGERARQLLKDVRDEIGKLLTESGKPKTKGPLDAAQRQLKSIEQHRLEAEQRLAELDINLDLLAAKRAEWTRLDDPVEVQRVVNELDETTRMLRIAEESVQSLQRFEIDERQSFQLFAAQQESLEALRSRASSIDENRTRFKQLSLDFDSKDEALAAARAALDLVSAGKARIDHDTDQNDTEVLKLQRLETLSQKARTRQTLQSRLVLLQTFDARLISNDAALKSVTVDDAAMKIADAIARDMHSVNTRMESQAARLTITHRPGAQVVVNGEAAPPSLSRAITEPLSIAIGEDVSISISPPASSLATAEAEQREQQLKLRALLARHGASTLAELQQMRAERLVLEEEAQLLKAERTALGLTEPTAATEIMRLSIEIRQIDTEVQRVLLETGSASLPPETQIDRQRQALHQTRSELKAARAQSESLIAGHTDTINRLAQARAALTGQIKELDFRIAADLALLPDGQRQQMLGDAERELQQRASIHRARAALLGEKRQTAPSAEDLDRLRLRAERLKAAKSNHQTRLDALRIDIAKLEGQVLTAGGDGLGEHVAELQAESAIAQAEVRRQTERADVLLLLRSVVETAYEKRREQLNAPLLRHLKPFLQDVFPQAEIALGDGFSVEGLKRSGPRSELFGRLSHGTQEQVAVLVRLAMGAMIADKGHDVPIILDDALVYSDDARIEQMFDAINRAGRNQQVIVLTCRARSFASLGGNQLRIT